MYSRNLILFFVVIFVFSCKNETPQVGAENQSSPQASHETENGKKEGYTVDGVKILDTIKEQTRTEPEIEPNTTIKPMTNTPDKKGSYVDEYKNSKLLPIPDPSTLLPKSVLKKVFGPLESYSVKSGNLGGEEISRSTFFRWVTPSKPNAGVMLQIMNNSVSDEAANWPTLFIQSKIMDGEQQAFTEKVYPYKAFKDLGDGAYSSELGKYHWRLNDDYIFLLAFNIDATPEQKLKYAVTLGQEVMKNFKEQMGKK